MDNSSKIIFLADYILTAFKLCIQDSFGPLALDTGIITQDSKFIITNDGNMIFQHIKIDNVLANTILKMITSGNVADYFHSHIFFLQVFTRRILLLNKTSLLWQNILTEMDNIQLYMLNSLKQLVFLTICIYIYI